MTRSNKIRALVAIASAAAINAQAALPVGVTDSITQVGTDGATLVGAMAVVGAAVYLISKLLRKFGVML